MIKVSNKNEVLNKAIAFAVEKHKHQVRKGTDIPYILHPLEALQILYSMGADTDVMVAGVLHDTLEDTDTTDEEIKSCFGERVLELVKYNSEDKTKSWYERKKHTITMLEKAPKDVQMLILADKLSNLRSIARDYGRLGDELWNRFNAPKGDQAWYYSGIQDSIIRMQDYPECKDFYWEFVGLFKDVFVKYYIDEKNQVIYQMCGNDGAYNKRYDYKWYVTDAVPECLKEIGRLRAEFVEDMWKEELLRCHEKDMLDGQYVIYSTSDREVTLIMNDGELTFCVDDNISDNSEKHTFEYTLDKLNANNFMLCVRAKKGVNAKLENVLKKLFDDDDGYVKFVTFCTENHIKYTLSAT